MSLHSFAIGQEIEMTHALAQRSAEPKEPPILSSPHPQLPLRLALLR